MTVEEIVYLYKVLLITSDEAKRLLAKFYVGTAEVLGVEEQS